MKVEYVENGRFGQAVWIHTHPEDCLTEYHSTGHFHEEALAIGKALELWKGLTASLVQAGQAGTLDCGIKEMCKHD